MLREMREQPDRVAAALRGVAGRADVLRGLLDSAEYVILVGRGSSRSAATYGAEALRTIAGKPAFSMSPPQLGWGDTALDLRRALVVAISQSGESAEIEAAAKRALAGGARVLVMTNSTSADLAGLVSPDHVLDYHAGTELAVPATKTFTSSLACLYGLAVASIPRRLAEAVDILPLAMQEVLDNEACRFTATDATQYVLFGEGYGESVAEEGAIKLRETLQLGATSFEASEFLHGSVNSVRNGTTVIAVGCDQLGSQLAEQGLRQAAARGGRVVFLGASAPSFADQCLSLPTLRPELMPFLGVLPIQLASYAACLSMGMNPDSPRGLTKITRITESG